MFNRTRRRLVLINVMVLFILLNFMGFMVYFYMHYRTMNQVRLDLLEQKSDIVKGRTDDLQLLLKPDHENSRQLVYLLWNQSRTFSKSFPIKGLPQQDVKAFSQHLKKAGIQSIHINKTHYFYISLSASHLKLQGQQLTGMTIQVIYNLQREDDLLHDLLFVIEVSSLISILLAIVAGLYLARKSLIPIKRAWDKQQQFVADASHELRTPLSVMKLNLEHLFRHPDKTIEQESETILQSIQEINYMTKMTKELLTLARSDSNEMVIQKETLLLSALFKKVAKDFQPLADMKRISLEVQVADGLELRGDSERLKQLLVILIDNAIKYTNGTGMVTISAYRLHSRIHLDIMDTGIGISAEDLPHIFNRYFRGDKSRTRQNEGTGLGLSIAQWIVHAHGGKIRVESKEGKGTHIMITLPVR